MQFSTSFVHVTYIWEKSAMNWEILTIFKSSLGQIETGAYSVETATRTVIVDMILSYILNQTEINDTPIVEWDNYASKITLDAWNIA